MLEPMTGRAFLPAECSACVFRLSEFPCPHVCFWTQMPIKSVEAPEGTGVGDPAMWHHATDILPAPGTCCPRPVTCSHRLSLSTGTPGLQVPLQHRPRPDT